MASTTEPHTDLTSSQAQDRPVPQASTRFLVARAKYLLPMSDFHGVETRIEDGYVLSEGQKILEAGAWSDEIGARITSTCGHSLTIVGATEGSTQVPCLNAVLLPGFVKAHGHDHESPIIGIAKGVPLVEWLDRAVNLFTGFMNEKREELVTKFGKSPNLVTYLKARVDDLHYGITTSMVHHCNHNKYRVAELREANRAAGTKMIIACGSQDRNYDARILDTPPTVATARLDDYVTRFGGPSGHEARPGVPLGANTWLVPGPDQFFSNGPELLQELKRWSREHRTLIHIHSSEEPNTTKWFTEKYGMTPVQYAQSIGFLDENSILAHQVNNTEQDLEILKSTGARIVHNPLANTILGSGMPDIIKMRHMGIPVACSTDGSGSADNQNIIGAAKCAVQYQLARHADPRLLPEIDLLAMITRIPASMLQLQCGQLAPGFDADMCLVDLERPNMIPTSVQNVVENLIWAADGSEVRWVVANGVLVKDNYRITSLDINEILTEVAELQRMYLAYAAKAQEIQGTGARQANL
eukprot:gnl/Trimastix_PCT/1252.p1 GENE.gnl/Trimastix_PCT/1252~~gnl/Trimastix_PCT/1252.p1  ORF type:complete len:552 (+),score=142.94 gnl/Trimastix_PCT/1252:76-1656(+)